MSANDEADRNRRHAVKTVAAVRLIRIPRASARTPTARELYAPRPAVLATREMRVAILDVETEPRGGARAS